MMCYFNQSNVAHVTPYHIYFEFLQCYIYKLISWYIYYLLTQLLISLLFNITTHFNFYEYIISTLFWWLELWLKVLKIILL